MTPEDEDVRNRLKLQSNDIADIPAASLWELCRWVDLESKSTNGLNVYKRFKWLMEKKEAEKLKVPYKAKSMEDVSFNAKGLEGGRIQEIEDARRCDICGKLYSYWNTYAFSIVSRPNNLLDKECQEAYLTVCSKCLPNLNVKMEIALLEVSRALTTSKGEAIR